MIQEWINLARQPSYRRHIVFLEDYDIDLHRSLCKVSMFGSTRRGAPGRHVEQVG